MIKLLYDNKLASEEKIQSWIDEGSRLIKIIEKTDENIFYIASTGSGKTMVSFEVAMHFILLKKILFIVPAKVLADQHHNLFKILTDNNFEAKIITGSTGKRKIEDWSKPSIIFATPQVVENDYHDGLLQMKVFALLIVDECHKAVGEYSYVKCTQIAYDNNLTILGLSASPGESEENCAEIMKNCHISKIVKSTIPSVENNTSVKYIDMIESMEKIDQLLKSIMKSVLKKMIKISRILDSQEYYISCKTDRLLTRKEIEEVSELIESIPDQEQIKWRLITGVNIYQCLSYLLKTIITVDFSVALSYIGTLKKKKKKYTKLLFKNKSFLRVIVLLKGETIHPKAIELHDKLIYLKYLRKTAIIFIENKKGGKNIYRYLKKKGLKVDIIRGGSLKKNKIHTEKALNQLKKGKLQFLVSTSVAREGVDIPKLDFVIFYTLPYCGIERIQGGGRTGRNEKGDILYLVQKHEIDISCYHTSRRREDKSRFIANNADKLSPCCQLDPYLIKTKTEATEISLFKDFSGTTLTGYSTKKWTKKDRKQIRLKMKPVVSRMLKRSQKSKQF